MATHSSIFAWKIPWAEEPGRLQSLGSTRVGHNWSNRARTCTRIRQWFTAAPVSAPTFLCFRQPGSIQKCPALSLASLDGGSGSCPYSYANSWPNPHRSSTQWWCKWGLWGPKPVGNEHEEQRSHEPTVSTVVKDTAQEQGASLSGTQSTTPFNRLTFAGVSGGTAWGIKKLGQSLQW